MSRHLPLHVLINTSRRAAPALALALAATLAGCGGDPPTYAFGPTTRCLEREADAVVPLDKEDVAAYAIPERLAPRSVSVFSGSDTIVLVFERDVDAAHEVAGDVFETFERAGEPKDVYRRGNAFFFGPNGVSDESEELVEGCLREAPQPPS